MRAHEMTRKILRAAAVIVSMVWIGGCISVGTPTQPLPLPDPAIQKHEFEADKMTAMQSVMSVFQDLGYVLETADQQMGLITASSPARRPGKLLSPSLIVNGEPIVSTTQAHATATIEEFRPGIAAIRLNFVVSTYSENQTVSTKRDDQVLDAATYDQAFVRIQEAIDVRRTGAAGSPPSR